MHKADIVSLNEAEWRIVNSTMLVWEGEEVGQQQQREFLTTE
jgi:hypothetical protein